MAPAETSHVHTTPSFPKPSGEYWIEALENGVHVLIRPLQAKDRQREKAFIERLSPESRHFRFLCQGLRQMYSIDAAANQAMPDLAKGAGFTTAADPDDPSQVIHRLSLI
ncbi:MAG: hypothetical protein ACN6OX_12070 [Pseudomonas sp.]